VEDFSDSEASSSASGGSGGAVLAPVLSAINFVDLAGSERLSQAGVTDDADRERLRQKEVRRGWAGGVPRCRMPSSGHSPQPRL
jgi:hypothetical protein